MKERWHKEKYVILSALCLSLLFGPKMIYGQEVNSTNVHSVEKQVEVQQENQIVQEGQNSQDTQDQQEDQNSREGNDSEQSQQSEGEGKNNQNNNKSGKQQQTSDPMQVCLLLAALFGVGSLTAVLSSILYKIYLSRKVNSLPVLYYGKKEEEVYE